MTVGLNDPATLADLVRFGPVPHDVEAAARQQLPFENKFRALTAYTENRGVWGTDEIRQSRSQRAEVVDPAPKQQVWKHLRASTVHEGIDPGHVSGEDGVTRNQDPGELLEEGDLSGRV